MGWISVRNWRQFQHYDPAKRVPPWIKNHTELMGDDAYLGLSMNRRGVLHGLWVAYASARCQLPDDPATISRRLNGRVTRADLDALNEAGFIHFVASRTLAEGYHDASAVLASRAPARSREVEVEAEKEEETPLPSFDDSLEELPPFVPREEELRAIVARRDQVTP